MKMRKSLVLLGSLCLVIVFAGLPLMLACAQPAPAPAPAPTPAPTPTPAPAPAPAPTPTPAPAPEEVWELKYSAQDAQGMWGVDNCDTPWCEKVEEVTKGRVKVTPYYSQTLCKSPDNWDATKSGVCDISWTFVGYLPGMAPLTDVVTLPFLGINKAAQCGAILWQLHEKFPEIQQEYAGNKVLLFKATNPYFIATSEKQVKTVEDLKGLKLRVHAGPPTEAMKALGAVPLLMPAPDLYTSLEKGVLDGVVYAAAFTHYFKLDEVVQYYTWVPIAPSYGVIPMNWDTWNSLPPDIQEQIMSIGGLEGSMWWSYGWDCTWDYIKNLATERGNPFIEYFPPPEEYDRFAEIGGKPIWNKWLANCQGKGLPAQEVLDETLRLMEEGVGLEYTRPLPALGAPGAW